MGHLGTKYDIKNITECLKIGCEALNKIGAYHWLADGGLFAIARTGEVFENDHDWDIGILVNGIKPNDIINSIPMERLGWSDEIIFGKQQGCAFRHKDWIFDLRFWYEADKYLVNAQRYINGLGNWSIGTFYESARLFSELKMLNYHGVNVPAPLAIDDYLVERYGMEWNTMPLTGDTRWWIYTKSFKLDNEIWEKIK